MESPRSSEKYPQKITQMIFFFFFSFSEGGEGVSLAEDFICYLKLANIKKYWKECGEEKKEDSLHSLLVEFKSYSLVCLLFEG